MAASAEDRGRTDLCRISRSSWRNSRSASAPTDFVVEELDDDDPILRSVDGTIVDTWRESYPYEERMPRHEYEGEKRLLQIELVKMQNWMKDTGAAR